MPSVSTCYPHFCSKTVTSRNNLNKHISCSEDGGSVWKSWKGILAQCRARDGGRVKIREFVAWSKTAIFIDAWSVPIPHIFKTFQLVHKAGMESGDLEEGYRSWAVCNLHAYIAGFPLDHIGDGKSLIQQL
jgi:hypothetical protein